MRSALAGTAVAAAASQAPAAATGVVETDASHATATYQTLQKYACPGDGSALYHENYPQSGSNPYSSEWPFSQAHVAALDLTGIQAAGAGKQYCDMFYDDNEWVGLEKAQQYLMTGDSAALQRAEDIFALVLSGWDTDASHADPGGVLWTQATWSHDRNTVSDMPGAELRMRPSPANSPIWTVEADVRLAQQVPDVQSRLFQESAAAGAGHRRAPVPRRHAGLRGPAVVAEQGRRDRAVPLRLERFGADDPAGLDDADLRGAGVAAGPGPALLPTAPHR